MKNVRIALIVTITLAIVGLLINAFVLGYDSDKFPVTIYISLAVLSFLILTVYSGLKSNDRNRTPDIIFLIMASLFMILPGLTLVRMVQNYHEEFLWIAILSFIYLLLYLTYLLLFLGVLSRK